VRSVPPREPKARRRARKWRGEFEEEGGVEKRGERNGEGEREGLNWRLATPFLDVWGWDLWTLIWFFRFSIWYFRFSIESWHQRQPLRSGW
jgi:hypothetical protein